MDYYEFSNNGKKLYIHKSVLIKAIVEDEYGTNIRTGTESFFTSQSPEEVLKIISEDKLENHIGKERVIEITKAAIGIGSKFI
jgi:hypothetical protein